MKSLKECLYNTVHRNQKPLKQIADELGISESYLYRSALPDGEDSETGTGCRFPLKKLIPLIRTTEDYSVLDYIERSLGRVAFTIPAPNPAVKIQSLCHLALRTVTEFGQLMGEVDGSLADRKITAAEKARIAEEGYEALQAIATLLHHIER